MSPSSVPTSAASRGFEAFTYRWTNAGQPRQLPWSNQPSCMNVAAADGYSLEEIANIGCWCCDEDGIRPCGLLMAWGLGHGVWMLGQLAYVHVFMNNGHHHHSSGASLAPALVILADILCRARLETTLTRIVSKMQAHMSHVKYQRHSFYSLTRNLWRHLLLHPAYPKCAPFNLIQNPESTIQRISLTDRIISELRSCATSSPKKKTWTRVQYTCTY